VRSATGEFGSIVLFGGTSELGQATLLNVLSPVTQHVVLVSRNIEGAQACEESILARAPHTTISHIRFDGRDAHSMVNVVQEVTALLGDIDLAIIAHAVLGAQSDGFTDPASVIEVIDVNVTATMSLMYAIGARMRTQKHGVIAVYSSVAGVRVRKANPVYGASKAALDSFSLAVGHELQSDGVSVVVIRPGFVFTKMTAGMKKAPFATTPDKAGLIASQAIKKEKSVVYAPAILRYVFAVLSVMPIKIWRRLPIHD
jgi:decaprenylphospho-beta-D-erythro-pentofuranosid-2-ulose 2-reductase